MGESRVRTVVGIGGAAARAWLLVEREVTRIERRAADAKRAALRQIVADLRRIAGYSVPIVEQDVEREEQRVAALDAYDAELIEALGELPE